MQSSGRRPCEASAAGLPAWLLSGGAKGKGRRGGKKPHTTPTLLLGKLLIFQIVSVVPPDLSFLFEACFFCHRLAAVVTCTCKGLVLFGK